MLACQNARWSRHSAAVRRTVRIFARLSRSWLISDETLARGLGGRGSGGSATMSDDPRCIRVSCRTRRSGTSTVSSRSNPAPTSEEISAACRRLARTFHPDRNASPRAHEEMQVVNAVRHLLADPRRAAAYDGARRRYLTTATGPPDLMTAAVPAAAPSPARPFVPAPSATQLADRELRAWRVRWRPVCAACSPSSDRRAVRVAASRSRSVTATAPSAAAGWDEPRSCAGS